MSLSFLIEGRRENILDRFSENPELLGVVEEFLDYEFNLMTNYKYVDWVMRKNFDDTGNLIIPFNEIISYLERFDNIRKNLDKKDINQYNSIQEFVDTIEKYGSTSSEKRSELKSGTEKIYEDDKVLVVKPLTKEASCYYGSGTRWCTAAKEFDNRFDSYFKMGPLYYFINKTLDKNNDYYKVAIHYDSKRDNMILYDAKDNVNYNLLGLVKTSPAFEAIQQDIEKNHLYDISQEGVDIIKKIFSEDIYYIYDNRKIRKIHRMVSGKPLRINQLTPNIEATWGITPITLEFDGSNFIFNSEKLNVFERIPIKDLVDYYEMLRGIKIGFFNKKDTLFLDFLFAILTLFVGENEHLLIKDNDDIVYWSPKNTKSGYSFESLSPDNAYIKFLNYIIEKENVGEPATKRDFLLNVLNKDPQEVDFSGYLSTMFGSMRDAGLITIYKSNERPYFRYKIGPNYELWKEGKLKRI